MSDYLTVADLDIGAFAKLCATATDPAGYPLAVAIEQRVPVYDGTDIAARVVDPVARRAIAAEWARVFSDGPGVLAIRDAFADTSAIDAMTATFQRILASERAAGLGGTDHYAKPGANSRIWNVLQKAALVDPAGFVAYYANPVLALVAEAWLGPWYQISAQVNIVHPGGAAQSPHSDYHLGFRTNDEMARFPPHVHQLSPVLTLQGAVAHVDMPLESGPTLYMPYSQRYPLNYLAWRDGRFKDYFAAHHVQLSLAKGDAVFFNPGLHHAAGTNHTTDVDRIGNLLQISSAFGRPMENIDTYAIAIAVYPHVLDALDRLSGDEVDAVIAASADGYSFPSNLDTDPPSSGLAPPSAQHVMATAIAERWPLDRFRAEMQSHQAKRRS
jgi:ectoine hydroxylase-related dioxygenase (phytanoyl-CoA dioxygenase family)